MTVLFFFVFFCFFFFLGRLGGGEAKEDGNSVIALWHSGDFVESWPWRTKLY